MASVNKTGEKNNPFPGLRPFTTGEFNNFFGRESESKDIVEKLIKNRFVAVTGDSGCGKSSLIHCGIIPELKARSAKELSSWRIYSIKPGRNPFISLTEAFVENYINTDPKRNLRDEILGIINENTDGIAEALNKLKIKEDEKILLVIDQFEELFRYGSPEIGIGFSKESEGFINQLTSAITGESLKIFAIIALRADLISECAHFKIFTHLINNSNFLVPRMTRENFREVIIGPVRNAGAKIDEDLVEILLNDVSGRTDQLPVLQHALMRTWDRWKELEEPERPLSLSDYRSIGTMKDAISRHSDEEYEKMNPAGKKICEKLFKIITGKGSDNKGIRYPSDIKTIRSVIPCSFDELKEVVEKFRDPSISVLTPYHSIELNDNSIIDLSHESLIRLWERLKKWVDEEAESVQMYLHLSELSALYQQGKAGLLKQPDLQLAIKWRDDNKPTLWWAQKYNPAYERAMVYLRTSEKEFLETEEQKARQHRWRLKRIRLITSILGGVVLFTVLLLAGVSLSKIRADNKRREAENTKKVLAIQKSLADEYATIALQRLIESDSNAVLSARRELQEREAKETAESLFISAKKDAESSKKLQLITLKKADSLRQAGIIAVEQKKETERKRMISVAKSMSLRSVQVAGQKTLQALLAHQAYLFNKRNSGKPNDADIYAGLYSVAKENGSPNYMTFSGHEGQVKGIAFIPGTKEFFTSGSDGKILRWNLDNKAGSFKIVYSNNEIIEVMAVSPNADWLACGGASAAIKMIPVNGIDTPYELKGHTGKIRSLIFSFDGKILYSAALDGKVLKWDLAARISTDLSTDGTQITSIDLSSNGKFLAGVSSDGTALVWNPDDKTARFSIGATGKTIRAVRFKPGEERIAVGYNDGMVEIWNTGTREKISEFIAHSGEVNNLQFNSKNPQMATAGDDGSLKIWDTGDLTSLPVTFNDNGGLVIALEFSPDGEVILSGTIENKPQVIGRPTNADTFVADGCKYVTRNFTPQEWLTYVGLDIPFEKTCPEADFKIRIKEVK